MNWSIAAFQASSWLPVFFYAMKFTTLFLSGFVALLYCGCVTQKASRKDVPTLAPLTRPLDAFCRNPDNGVFSLPRLALGYYGDVLIADTNGVRFGWTRNGVVIPSAGVEFRSKLPSVDEMVAISKGQAELELFALLGKPNRTWYDLVPILDSVVPITRIAGRDVKHCDYDLFTTTPNSDIIEMTISLTYNRANDSGKNWILSGKSWKIAGGERSGGL
jgi:hypothetical protein